MKKPSLFIIGLLLAACTDYMQQYEQDYKELFGDAEAYELRVSDAAMSSNAVKSSGSKSSSSVNSSGSEESSSSSKSSSSIKSCSSAKSSSSAKSGTSVQSSSSSKIMEYGTCAPLTNPISQGQSVAWQMIKNPAIGSAEVSNATYEWFFSGGNPETVAAKNNMLTNPITYATSGEKTAVLTFTPNNGSSVTIECSPLQVTESTTASSSSVPFSSSVHSSSSSIDACNDEMPVSKGSGIALSGNTEAPIGNTPWNIRQWYANGNASLTYYANGTFKANWNNVNGYMVRVGFFYDKNGSGKNVGNTHYSADYKYVKTGSASFGYIGVYGWTLNPMVEYYIVDDWYYKPVESYLGQKMGELTVDGATYTIYAIVQKNMPTDWGTSTILRISSVRATPRQCGHIDIQAHFNKWNELFTGQQVNLPSSDGYVNYTLKFGNVVSVNLLTETANGATGSVEYTYVNLSEGE